jgi:hypothetical protein
MTDLDKKIEEIWDDAIEYGRTTFKDFAPYIRDRLKVLLKAELESLRVEKKQQTHNLGVFKEGDLPQVEKVAINFIAYDEGYNQCAEEVNRKVDEKVAGL